jgi:hypothetical protein
MVGSISGFGLLSREGFDCSLLLQFELSFNLSLVADLGGNTLEFRTMSVCVIFLLNRQTFDNFRVLLVEAVELGCHLLFMLIDQSLPLTRISLINLL